MAVSREVKRRLARNEDKIDRAIKKLEALKVAHDAVKIAAKEAADASRELEVIFEGGGK